MYLRKLAEVETMRRERLPQIMAMPEDQRAKALDDSEAELAGQIPEQLASRVMPLPSISHVWEAFWELDSERPITNIPVGLGGSIPFREAIPWGKVEEWMDRREILDPWDRSQFRQYLRAMETEYRKHQTEALAKVGEDG
jgi:hypothetical protein